MIALMVFTALLVYLGIAWVVIKRLPSKKAKWIAIAVFILIPTWDEILGRVYFKYLCETESGVHVYKTVELPAEYWDEQGREKFVDEKAGGFLLVKEYPTEYKTGTYSTFFHVDNAGYKRVDKQSGQILGEVTDFRYWGGWIRRNLSPHNTANGCEGRIERSNSLIKQIFKPKKS